MARTANTNYTAAGSAFVKATVDTDQFDAGDVQLMAEAIDLHNHDATRGLGVRRVQTGTAPTAAGTVQITGDTLRWWGATAGAIRTAVAVEGAQTLTGLKTLEAGSPTLVVQATNGDNASGSDTPVLRLLRLTTLTPATGLGGGIDMRLENGDGVTTRAADIMFGTSAIAATTITTFLAFSTQDVATSGAIPTERIRITGPGNVKVAGTAARATTEGTNHLDIFDGTAPVGTLAAGISLYSTTGELRVMDSGGTATLLSPHDRTTGEWVFDSTHTTSGKHLRIDVERMIRFLNNHFGADWVHEVVDGVVT